MATELDRTASLQSLADSTGLIYDRAVYPEKVIGQAWLISRGRVVTMASNVSNYTDAPWALIIKFPHPNLTYAVRTVTLHPDFNKREARDYYLAQARGPMPPPNFENDIATIALDSDLVAPEPERVEELNRALSVPFEISAQDMSGSMRGPEAMQVLQSAMSTGRSGLMTLVDQRNVPFARISIKHNRIVRAQFENLYNEIAMCELIQRHPPGKFALQPVDNYRWPADVPEIMTPPDQIIAEAMRRADELPRVIEMLGGPETRFDKATKLADFNSINPADRWVAERMWEVLDGYLPLGKVAERAGTDTYTTVKIIWDLATMGLIIPNQNPPFHSNGQLGPLLVPAQEMDIATWDTLTAMYLDPVSGGPTTVNGNFFGSAHVLTNKTLLHTAPIPRTVPSAAIFKDGKLVGIHAGPAYFNTGNAPPIPLQRMIWVGALNDLGARRLRNAEAAAEAADYADQDPQATSQRLSTLRNRPLTQETSKIIGAAATAGGAQQVGSQPYPEEEAGPLAKFSKKQIVMGGGAMFALGLVMMLGSMFAPHDAPAPAPQAAQQQETKKPEDPTKPTLPENHEDPDIGDTRAQELAMKLAGFDGKLPSSYKWKDTMKLTEPRESFGMHSEAKNTDILFIYWPNIAPMTPEGLARVGHKLPAYNNERYENRPDFSSPTDSPILWQASNYGATKDQKAGNFIIGVMPAPDPTKCIVWIARGATEGTAVPDLQYPSMVITQLMQQGKAAATAAAAKAKAAATAGGAAPAGDEQLATPEQLADYRKKLAGLIKANYKMPKPADEDADTNVGMSFSIDAAGGVGDLSLKPNTDEAFNRAIQKAVDASQPFPAPPHVKGKLQVSVHAEGANVTVEEQ
jgi:hypothetical protein